MLPEPPIQLLPVAPYTGAWIEICAASSRTTVNHRSLPTRERGLKSGCGGQFGPDTVVAPYTGAWIEILSLGALNGFTPVAPYTGAWIEIKQEQADKPLTCGRSLHGSVD